MGLIRLMRAENWWGSKLPPLFGVAFAEILLLEMPPGEAFLLLVCVLVVTGGSTGAYGHVVNDAFDVEVDRRIGKANRMRKFDPAVRAALIVGFALIACAPAFLLPYPPVTTALVGIELLLPALYSIPPVRLKDRGVLGVAADAAGAHVVPTLIVITAFAGGWPAAQLPFVAAAAVWSAGLGLRGILWHQRLDRDDDLEAGAKTLATAADPRVINAVLSRGVYPLEVLACLVMVVWLAPQAPLLAVFFVLWGLVDVVKMALGWSYVFDPREPELRRVHVPLHSNYFYELGFPLALAAHLTLHDPLYVILLVMQVGVFWPNIREQAEDLSNVWRDVRRKRALASSRRSIGWQLEVFEPARAAVEELGDGMGGVRVAVEAIGDQPWQVKLCRSFERVVGQAPYIARLEARSARTRRITLCLVEGHEPWGSLGLSEEIEIGPDWLGFVERFAATKDAEDVQFSVLMGQGRGAVELRSFALSVEVDQ
jgi:4-hydroxybenzoate polyprenyltransferase